MKLIKDAQGSGLCYWGGEMIAFDGPESTEGSSFENQALFDFQFKALPELKSVDLAALQSHMEVVDHS
ncbi:MAG: glycosyl hydrolase 53 family protein [Flavobacteriales bacterium]|nr:glycosyl hydrolase 53 family protein [Flavobacteriales bacterium]